MVCLDIMSRHDRERTMVFSVWTICPNVRAKKMDKVVKKRIEIYDL